MAETNRRPVCAVIGVGPGLGAALARRFAQEYTVALIARGEDKLDALAKEIETGGFGRTTWTCARSRRSGKRTRARRASVPSRTIAAGFSGIPLDSFVLRGLIN
jgi:NAD(P)-dependent dehydrogenase (short-subunit alcohol dehydrogenase family)